MIRFFDDNYWETYQGAERFRTGEPPMVAEGDDRVVIADRTGVTVILDDLVEWTMTPPARVEWTVDVAKEIVEMVVDASLVALTILGFKRV